jgi:hypothetical protein
MRLRCLVIALTLLLAAIASDSWGQSKQPSPKASQQKATQQERGSEDSPVVVKVLPAEKPKDELAREIEKQDADRQLVKLTGDLAHYARLLFWATGFLALVTGGLVYFGFRQVRDNRRSIKAAEDSTRIAERALTKLERPYLFILDYNWLLTEKAKADGPECGLVYTVANGGKLPAFIKAVKLGIGIGESIPSMQDEPPVHDFLTAPLIAGGEHRQVVQGFRLEDDDKPAHEYQIRGGMALIPGSLLVEASRVIAKISIEYDGPITTGHTTTACWEWHPVKYAFTQYGGPGHNQRT